MVGRCLSKVAGMCSKTGRGRRFLELFVRMKVLGKEKMEMKKKMDKVLDQPRNARLGSKMRRITTARGEYCWDGRPLERQRSGSPLQNLASVMIIKPFNPKSLFLLVHQTSRPEYLFLNCPLNQTLLQSMSTIPRRRCRPVGTTFYQTNFHCVLDTPTRISRRSRLARQQRTCRKQDGQDPRKGH